MVGRIGFKNIVREEMVDSRLSANIGFNEKVNKLKDSGKKIVHFGFGQSPFPVPDCLQDALSEFSHVNSYVSMSGIKILRRQLSNCHLLWDGIELNENNFIVGPGSKELLSLTLSNFNGVVLLPTPAWPTYQEQCHQAGTELVKLDATEADNWKISAGAIAKACLQLKHTNKLLIFTNPGNPNGQCFTEAEIIAISDVCKREGIIVASDEIYSRITHTKEHFCMSKYYPEGTILFCGFSKWLSIGGWRLGYVHFPEMLQDLFNSVNCSASHTYTCAPSPMQYAVEKVLRENYQELDNYRQNCCKVLKIVGEFCHRELESVGVRGCKSEAGYYYIPNFEVIRPALAKRGILTGKQMTAAILEETGVALLSTGEAFNRSDSELCVRFCFVCFDGNLAINNLNKLENGLEKITGISEDKFVKQYCQELYDGVQILKKWVRKQSNLAYY